jgi:hypothetical protein
MAGSSTVQAKDWIFRYACMDQEKQFTTFNTQNKKLLKAEVGPGNVDPEIVGPGINGPRSDKEP